MSTSSVLAAPPARDLDEILDRALDDMRRFANARIYVTGGTGFVGTWFVAAVLAANRRANLNISLDLVTRDARRVAHERPFLVSDERVRLIERDVTDAFDLHERYDAVVHAATAANATLNATSPRAMLDTILRGGEHALAASRQAGGVPLLFTSSGAIYGAQPPRYERIGEGDRGGPNPLDPASAYAEGKRLGELQCALAAADGTQAKIARLFAFVGPYLPLDRHFAVGNFLRDALAGDTIRVGGDGSPFRSYLYASEMTIWLWAIFARGANGRAYNVGSDEALDIEALAKLIASEVAPGTSIAIAKHRDAAHEPARYVPDVSRAERELGLRREIGLREAIARTAEWHRGAARIGAGAIVREPVRGA